MARNIGCHLILRHPAKVRIDANPLFGEDDMQTVLDTKFDYNEVNTVGNRRYIRQ